MKNRIESALLFQQFIRFAGAGAFGTVLHYLVLTFLVYLANADPVAASASGFAAGAAVNYWLNHRYTFRSRVSHTVGFAKFALVAVAGLLLNSAIMAVMTWGLGLDILLSQVAATGVVLLWNFSVNRAWTFKDA